MTYPDGRTLSYNYSGGVDDAVSRLSSISDSTGTLEGYSYLGLDTVVKRAHPLSGVDQTFIKMAAEGVGDAGDQYVGLDRFGRVVDLRWQRTSDGSYTDRFRYGYDRDGNVLYKENVVNALFSELYHANGASSGYDQLNQLTAFSRGTLSDANADGVPDTVASPSRSQSWSLDAQGNWGSVTSDGTTQTRSANAQNQVTSVSGATTPAYDADGDLTTDEQGRTLVYDGWNRLVEVKSGATTLNRYGYDAMGRRVTESGGTKALYYSAGWQVVEERDSGVARAQYVFSPVYVDALIERDRDADLNGSLEERLWAQQDANWNVTAVTSGSGGTVVERYVYDPYGAVTALTAAWGTPGASAYAWRYGHQGGRLDPATGYYNFRNREYSPTLGRWLQVDPLGFTAGDTNLYRAYGNVPTSAVDPLGLEEYQ